VADAGSRERAGRQSAIAGLPVACDGLHEEAEQRARGAVGERAVPAHPLARAEEARAEHVVGAPAGDGLEHAVEVGGVVLAVAVQVDGCGVALVAGDLEPGAERGAEATGDGMCVHPRTVLAGDLRRGVARAVVHDQHVDGQSARLGGNACEHVAHGGLLVAGDDDRKAAVRNSRIGRNCPAEGAYTPPGAGRLAKIDALAAVVRPRRARGRVLHRHHRPSACCTRRPQPQQPRDGLGQLEHRARLA